MSQVLAHYYRHRHHHRRHKHINTHIFLKLDRSSNHIPFHTNSSLYVTKIDPYQYTYTAKYITMRKQRQKPSHSLVIL